ncbi:MAG TPA: protein-disulfide reductase DsbD domain-containing protein [Blastocatellia bacterium]|nr:protein-disulfide reductase DsbD domain-containing protein [Blastocatellia bacterium]
MRKLLLLIALIGCFSIAALAQTSATVVKVSPGESVYKIKKGVPAKLSVVLNIDEGYHINSNRPSEKYLIATALKFEPLSGLSVGRVVYPKAKMQKFEFSEKPLSVFDGKTVLTVTARALPALAAGNHTLKGKLTVQACNDQACLPPKTVDVQVPIEVVQ